MTCDGSQFVIGPALLRLVLMGRDLAPTDMARIVERPIEALRPAGH